MRMLLMLMTIGAAACAKPAPEIPTCAFLNEPFPTYDQYKDCVVPNLDDAVKLRIIITRYAIRYSQLSCELQLGSDYTDIQLAECMHRVLPGVAYRLRHNVGLR